MSAKACGLLTERADSEGEVLLKTSEDSSKCIYFQSFADDAARPGWLMNCIDRLLSNLEERNMKPSKIVLGFAGLAVLAVILTSGMASAAQECMQEPAQ